MSDGQRRPVLREPDGFDAGVKALLDSVQRYPVDLDRVELSVVGEDKMNLARANAKAISKPDFIIARLAATSAGHQGDGQQNCRLDGHGSNLVLGALRGVSASGNQDAGFYRLSYMNDSLRRVRSAAIGMAVAVLCAGCSAEVATGTAENEPGRLSGASTPVTVEQGSPVGEPQTEPEPGQIKLWVSNQSFADDPIDITIAVGDVVVVERSFEVLGQHNWIAFDISGLEPGRHLIHAESGTGATLSEQFTVLADEPRWLLIDYWYYPEDAEGRHFTLVESDEPIGFA